MSRVCLLRILQGDGFQPATRSGQFLELGGADRLDRETPLVVV